MKNSDCSYPTDARSKPGAPVSTSAGWPLNTIGIPPPPVTGPDTVGDAACACATPLTPTPLTPTDSKSAHDTLHMRRRAIPPTPFSELEERLPQSPGESSRSARLRGKPGAFVALERNGPCGGG